MENSSPLNSREKLQGAAAGTDHAPPPLIRMCYWGAIKTKSGVIKSNEMLSVGSEMLAGCCGADTRAAWVQRLPCRKVVKEPGMGVGIALLIHTEPSLEARQAPALGFAHGGHLSHCKRQGEVSEGA